MGIGRDGLQVWEQFPKFRASITYRFLQGNWILKCLCGFEESLGSHPQCLGHFLEPSRTAQLLPESSGYADNPMGRFSLVNRDANGP
jgi:hypothetical protein